MHFFLSHNYYCSFCIVRFVFNLFTFSAANFRDAKHVVDVRFQDEIYSSGNRGGGGDRRATRTTVIGGKRRLRAVFVKTTMSHFPQ